MGRLLMIWGRRPGGKIENGFIFSAVMLLENYLFLENASWNLFFPGEGLWKCIVFQGGGPFEISFFLRRAFSDLFFFLRKAFWHLFFPGEGLSTFIFFPGEGPPRCFFLNFLRASPQIINDRPLNLKVKRPKQYYTEGTGIGILPRVNNNIKNWLSVIFYNTCM